MESITRKHILDKYIQVRQVQSIEEVISEVVSEHQGRYKHQKTLTSGAIATLKHDFQTRWKKACYVKERFFKNNSDWLTKEVKLSTDNTSVHRVYNEPSTSKQGRSPVIEFQLC